MFYFFILYVILFRYFFIVISDKNVILNLSKLDLKANHRLYPTLG